MQSKYVFITINLQFIQYIEMNETNHTFFFLRSSARKSPHKRIKQKQKKKIKTQLPKKPQKPR